MAEEVISKEKGKDTQNITLSNPGETTTAHRTPKVEKDGKLTVVTY